MRRLHTEQYPEEMIGLSVVWIFEFHRLADYFYLVLTAGYQG